MIGKGILRYGFLPANITIVLEHAREVNALHMVSCGIPSKKPFVADYAVAVRNTSRFHFIFTDELVKFFRVGKILSKFVMACISKIINFPL